MNWNNLKTLDRVNPRLKVINAVSLWRFCHIRKSLSKVYLRCVHCTGHKGHTSSTFSQYPSFTWHNKLTSITVLMSICIELNYMQSKIGVTLDYDYVIESNWYFFMIHGPWKSRIESRLYTTTYCRIPEILHDWHIPLSVFHVIRPFQLHETITLGKIEFYTAFERNGNI